MPTMGQGPGRGLLYLSFLLMMGVHAPINADEENPAPISRSHHICHTLASLPHYLVCKLPSLPQSQLHYLQLICPLAFSIGTILITYL